MISRLYHIVLFCIWAMLTKTYYLLRHTQSHGIDQVSCSCMYPVYSQERGNQFPTHIHYNTVPSKIKSNLNSHCQLRCDDWGFPNTKLKYCQCASAAPRCYQIKQIFYCVQWITTCNWWFWTVLFFLHLFYKISSATWWLLLCIWK